MEINVKRATTADARELAPGLRAEDAAEVVAGGATSSLAALLSSLYLSRGEAWTVRVDGEIMAMWGLVSLNLLTGLTVPWLLTSGLVDRHPRVFMRLCKLYLPTLGRGKILINMVDVRYEKALRWAKRVGFEVGEAQPVNGHDFCMITLRGV